MFLLLAFRYCTLEIGKGYLIIGGFSYIQVYSNEVRQNWSLYKPTISSIVVVSSGPLSVR